MIVGIFFLIPVKTFVVRPVCQRLRSFRPLPVFHFTGTHIIISCFVVIRSEISLYQFTHALCELFLQIHGIEIAHIDRLDMPVCILHLRIQARLRTLRGILVTLKCLQFIRHAVFLVIQTLLLRAKMRMETLEFQRFDHKRPFSESRDQTVTGLHALRSQANAVIQVCQLVYPFLTIFFPCKHLQQCDLVVQRRPLHFLDLVLQDIMAAGILRRDTLIQTEEFQRFDVII